MDQFIAGLPKAELHCHIEGTLEPRMMLDLAARDGVELPFETLTDVETAYSFSSLQDFLDIYYRGAAVLRTPQSFYDLMDRYLLHAERQGVVRAEMMFDPQTHTGRGIGYEVFMEGFRGAMADHPTVSTGLILCFLRHLSGDDAVATIRAAEPHLEGVIAVGLDSAEAGNPPELFVEAYEIARSFGLRAVAHAGEEGPPDYVRKSLDILGAERIDHGIRSLEDPGLVERLAREQVPLTVCPLSNVALRVVDTLADHPLPQMMDLGLLVSVHSDDPAYFGGYIGDNFAGLRDVLGMTDEQLTRLASNSIASTFLTDGERAAL